MFKRKPADIKARDEMSKKFYKYIVKFFKEEDRFPSLSELQAEFGNSYTMTYKIVCDLEKSGKLERRDSETTNRVHWRFKRK